MPKATVASALFAALGPGAAPAASAEQSMHTFQVVFAYNNADAPQKICAELKNTAYQACRARRFSGPRLAWQIDACKNKVIAAALEAMKRNDVAMLHPRRA